METLKAFLAVFFTLLSLVCLLVGLVVVVMDSWKRRNEK